MTTATIPARIMAGPGGKPGLSTVRRMPRLGKIRLGVKLKSSKEKEYPVELPFFLLPDDVAGVFGGKIKGMDGAIDKVSAGNIAVERAMELGCDRKAVLDFIRVNYHRMAESLQIMIPIEDEEKFFPQAYIMYGSQHGWKCRGNGIVAIEKGEKGIITERECLCAHLKTEENQKGACTSRGIFMFMIPEVSVGGIYQVDLGSYHSIVDINSAVDYTRGLLGRVSRVPLTLSRTPKITHGSERKETHWTLQMSCPMSIEDVKRVAESDGRNFILHEASKKATLSIEHTALPEPEFENPDPDNEPHGLSEEILEGESEPFTYFDDVRVRLEGSNNLKEAGAVWDEIQKRKAELTADEIRKLTTIKLEVKRRIDNEAI